MIICPECKTSYQPERLGLVFGVDTLATVKCPVCDKAFDARLFVDTTVEHPAWWVFWRKPVESVANRAETKLRTE